MDKLNEKFKKALKKTLQNSKKISRKRKLSETNYSEHNLDGDDNEVVSPKASTSSTVSQPEQIVTGGTYPIGSPLMPELTSTNRPKMPTAVPSTSTDINRDSLMPQEVPSTSSEPHVTTDSLFAEKTPLYENEHLIVFVVKDYLKRQKIFQLDDHLYTVKIKLKDGHPPLLTSLLDVLRKVFEFIVKSIQNFYPKGKFSTLFYDDRNPQGTSRIWSHLHLKRFLVTSQLSDLGLINFFRVKF